MFSEHGINFSENGEGDFLRTFGADVQADWIVEFAKEVIAHEQAFVAKFLKHRFSATPRADETKIAEPQWEQRFEIVAIGKVMMRHHDGGGAFSDFRRNVANDEFSRGRESFACG